MPAKELGLARTVGREAPPGTAARRMSSDVHNVAWHRSRHYARVTIKGIVSATAAQGSLIE